MRAKTGVIKKENQLELKMFYQTHTTRKAAEITPPRQWQNGAICHCVTSFAASTYHSVVAGVDGSGSTFFVPGDLDLDIQTCLCEGPNTSSVWIRRKSVPQVFETQTKKVTDSAKNRTLLMCGKNQWSIIFHLPVFARMLPQVQSLWILACSVKLPT